jgi:hypothetical protein
LLLVVLLVGLTTSFLVVAVVVLVGLEQAQD